MDNVFTDGDVTVHTYLRIIHPGRGGYPFMRPKHRKGSRSIQVRSAAHSLGHSVCNYSCNGTHECTSHSGHFEKGQSYILEDLWAVADTETVRETGSRKQGSTIAYDVRVDGPEVCDASRLKNDTSKTPINSQKDTLKCVECMSTSFLAVRNSKMSSSLQPTPASSATRA
jgi:hypothetical protein